MLASTDNSMHATLDHLVLAGPDVAALATHITDRTGLAPRFGGHHDGRGTCNYLVGLGPGRYLELLGPDPDQPDPDAPRPMRVDDLASPRLVGWAVRTTDVDALVAAARERGYDPGDVHEMCRRTPDGTTLTWKLTPPEGGLGGVAPFVIDWLDSPHPSTGLPGVDLTSVTLAHPEPARVEAALTALTVDTSGVEVRPGARPEITARLSLPGGALQLP